MGYDQATFDIQLTAIQSAIATAIASPRPDWSVGQVKMNQAGYLKMLYEQQEKLIEMMKNIPVESIDTSQNAISSFGHDGNQYHDEEP